MLELFSFGILSPRGSDSTMSHTPGPLIYTHISQIVTSSPSWFRRNIPCLTTFLQCLLPTA